MTKAKEKTVSEQVEIVDEAAAEVPAVRKSLMERILEIQDDVASTPEQVTERMIRRILEAETAEEVFAPVATVDSEAMIGVPFTFVDADFNASTIEGGSGVYAVITFRDEDGVVNSFSCGSRMVCAQVLRAKTDGWKGMRLMLQRASQKTASGFYPLNLTIAPPEEEQF